MNTTKLRWYHSLLLSIGGWTCLLTALFNLAAAAAPDVSRDNPNPVYHPALLLAWEGTYAVPLGFGALNFLSRKLNWRFTLVLAGVVIADFFIWSTLEEPWGHSQGMALIFVMLAKFVCFLFLLLLAWMEFSLRKKQDSVEQEPAEGSQHGSRE